MTDRYHAWRYTFCDLRTRRPLARLPLVGADLSEVISGPADGSGSVPLTSEQVRRADPWAATQQRRTICFAERVLMDGPRELTADTLWAGIVWKRVRSGRSLALSMSTPESYWAHRRVALFRTFTDTEDSAIIRQIITDAQAQEGGSIGVALPGMPVDSTSDHTADPAEERTLLEEVQQVAGAAPLEFRILPGGNARDGFTLTLITSPRLTGTSAAQLLWTSSGPGRPGNEVLAYAVTEDGSGVPNALHGAAENPADSEAPLRTVQTSDEVARGYPLLEQTAAADADSITTQGRLDRAVAGELAQLRRDEVQLTSLTVPGDRGPDLASYTLGATVTVRAADVLWKEPTDFSGRLLARRILPGEPGRNESVVMTLGGT